MFTMIQDINKRPEPFSVYTTRELWDDAYTSGRMLEYHLDLDSDISSRNGGFIAESVFWMVDYFELQPESTVCDFGCAVGHYTSGLSRHGVQVTGLDFSRSSLAYARKKAQEEALEIDYRFLNYLEFVPDIKYDLALMIMNDFCVLSPVQRRKMLQIFVGSLKPGGKVLFDVYSLTAFARVEEKAVYEKNQLGGFWAETDYYAFVNTFKYVPEAVSLEKYTIIEPGRKRVIYNWLQYYSLDLLIDECELNGLEVTGVYGDVAGGAFDPEAPEFAIVACKV